jgi:hypothetical protein
LGDISGLTLVDQGLGLGFRVLWLTFRSDFFGLTVLTFWFDGCCGVESGDSGMAWHLPFGHFMDELWMDEVCGFGVSSTDFACIVRPMRVCNMFSECSLSGVRRSRTHLCISLRIECVHL